MSVLIMITDHYIIVQSFQTSPFLYSLQPALLPLAVDNYYHSYRFSLQHNPESITATYMRKIFNAI